MAHIYILITALAVAGWAAAYIGSRGAMKRTCEQMRADLRLDDLRLEFQRQIDALSENVKNLERTGGTSAPASTIALPEKKQPVVTNRVPHPPETGTAAEEITPEILRTLTETITALLGRKIRIRSVKILRTPDPSANSWAQHGRAVIQASHNLVQRGRDR
jgi:hypothetical protein